CFEPHQAAKVEDYVRRHGAPIEVHVGRTPEIIRLSKACLAVSGSVSLELLYQQKPTVIVYRISPLDLYVGKRFINCPYITLVNLLAQKKVFPEFLTDRCEAAGMASHVLRWLEQPGAYEDVCQELAELKRQVAAPGACARAANHVLDKLEGVRLPINTARQGSRAC
ncbi:MAG: hypothetical protein AB7K24_16190, partial [Gemmataceae bacterium]